MTDEAGTGNLDVGWRRLPPTFDAYARRVLRDGEAFGGVLPTFARGWDLDQGTWSAILPYATCSSVLEEPSAGGIPRSGDHTRVLAQAIAGWLERADVDNIRLFFMEEALARAGDPVIARSDQVATCGDRAYRQASSLAPAGVLEALRLSEAYPAIGMLSEGVDASFLADLECPGFGGHS